jgi:hypothetical protein
MSTANEKAARARSGSRDTITSSKCSNAAECVKHADWLKQQGATRAWARHMIALQILLRRAELRRKPSL